MTEYIYKVTHPECPGCYIGYTKKKDIKNAGQAAGRNKKTNTRFAKLYRELGSEKFIYEVIATTRTTPTRIKKVNELIISEKASWNDKLEEDNEGSPGDEIKGEESDEENEPTLDIPRPPDAEIEDLRRQLEILKSEQNKRPIQEEVKLEKSDKQKEFEKKILNNLADLNKINQAELNPELNRFIDQIKRMNQIAIAEDLSEYNITGTSLLLFNTIELIRKIYEQNKYPGYMDLLMGILEQIKLTKTFYNYTPPESKPDDPIQGDFIIHKDKSITKITSYDFITYYIDPEDRCHVTSAELSSQYCIHSFRLYLSNKPYYIYQINEEQLNKYIYAFINKYNNCVVFCLEGTVTILPLQLIDRIYTIRTQRMVENPKSLQLVADNFIITTKNKCTITISLNKIDVYNYILEKFKEFNGLHLFLQ
jgi:hypothetical protein